MWRDSPNDYTNPPCFAHLTIPGDPPCSGPLQLAHALPKGEIASYRKNVRAASRWVGHPILDVTEDEVIYDPDCGLVICERHHALWDGPLQRRPCLEQLPDHVHRWAEKYWLTDRLGRYYPARMVEAA